MFRENTLLKKQAELPISKTKPDTATIRDFQSTLFKTILSCLALSGLCYYAYLFLSGLSKLWFNPNVTTDDALQQNFMFHKITHPGIFENDLITQAMESYLAPAHYWTTYFATWASGSPVMGGHWVMLLQLTFCVAAVFFAVKKMGGFIPACFSVTWLLHSRHILQRMTGGLPRGWAAPILTATICFALYGNHYAVLAVLLFGCLSNPPGAMIAALFYGLLLIWRAFYSSTKELNAKNRTYLIQYIALSPIYLLVTWLVTRPPAHIGTMANYAQAANNPAFLRPGGRFPFIPLLSAIEEILNEGFFAFISLYERLPSERIEHVPTIVAGILAVIVLASFVRKRNLIPVEMLVFLTALFGVYFAARQIPFYLYVPDRHLRLPLGFFFICSLPVALWRLAGADRNKVSSLCAGVLLLGSLAGVIHYGSGLGLRGPLNFNVYSDRKGTLFTWLNENTSQNALIAGHPSHVDDTMLFAMRRAFITSETAHPFFDVYYKEVERRLRIVWQAYFETDLVRFYQTLDSEGIDYFVFRRNDFRRHMLAKAYYFEPFTAWVKELASKDPKEYAFSKFPPPRAAGVPTKILPFRDRHSIVVNIAELGAYLEEQKMLDEKSS